MSSVADSGKQRHELSFSRYYSWLMIFLLSLAPGLIIAWDWHPDGEDVWARRQMFSGWFKKNDALAERIFQATSPDFWCREMAVEYRNTVQALAAKTYDYRLALEQASELLFQKEKDRPVIMRFFSEDGNWAMTCTDRRISGYLFRQLFRQIADHFETGTSELSGSNWEQRIRTLFGKMAFIEMFLPDFRLKPVPVIFQGRNYYFTWEMLVNSEGGRVCGGFFMLLPVSFSRNNSLSEKIISDWPVVSRQVRADATSWPAMLNYRKDSAKSLVVHPALADATTVADIWNFFQRTFPEKSLDSEQSHLQLPVELMGKAFVLGGRIARICYSDPISGFAVLLLGDMPQIPLSPRQGAVKWYFTILAFIWSMFLVRCLIFRRLPTIKIQIRVLLWFSAFAAFPAGLTIGSLAATLQDLREVKISGLHRDLHQLVLRVEAEMAGVSEIFSVASANITSDEQIINRTFKLPAEPESDSELLLQIRSGFLRHGIDPAAVILVAQGGWCFSSFQKDSSAGYRRSSRALFGSILDKYLKQVDADLYQKYSPVSRYPDAERRVSAITSASDFRIQENFGLAKERFESVSDVFTGNDFALSYLHQINLDGRPFAVFMVLLRPETMYEKILRLRLPLEAVNYRRISGFSPDIAVYKNTGGQPELVEATGRTGGFDKLTLLPDERTAYVFDADYASIMVPSQRMPGYVFVARLPAYHVEMMIFFEQLSMVLTMLLLLVVVVSGSIFVSVWIGRPLRSFIPVLAKIGAGYIPADDFSVREDEIAATADSIQRMSEWIREREKIKRFVAPQAVNQVLANNFIKAGAGTIRKAIVLVSDIRSFTTISEEFRAEDVFDMVNHHLSAMAAIIEKKGGVIDRFVGDAVWAVFYEDAGTMCIQALEAAIAMKRVHRRIQEERVAAGLFNFDIGIGLARGEILAGIMGNSGVRLDYTIAGDTLHVAEDAETASKSGAFTGIVVTEDLKNAAAGFEYAPIVSDSRFFEVKSLAAQ